MTEAAWCAADQNIYFDYQHALYENFGVQFNRTSLVDLAVRVGLDRDIFSECLSNRTHQDDVENARQTALRQGVKSTPTFFINNRRIEGNMPYEDFQRVINQELVTAQ